MLFESKLHHRKIFLVDDDPTFCATMLRAAKAHGYEMRSFASAGDFIRAKSTERFDTVISDYDIGLENGVQIAERLSNLIGGPPVIIVSGSDRTKTKAHRRKCIKKFSLKSVGVGQILTDASQYSRHILPTINGNC